MSSSIGIEIHSDEGSSAIWVVSSHHVRRPQSRSPLADQESAGGAVRGPTRTAAPGSNRSALDCLSEAGVLDDDFDFSTPEGEAAIRVAISLVLEVREAESRLARKVRLYERTLGLAVIPVLLRRALIAVKRRGLWLRRGR
jgi:hypothetical protein